MSVLDLCSMGKGGLLALRPIHWGIRSMSLSPEEALYVARTLGAFWQYDYKAQRDGRPGLHAVLNSGRHSDGFIDFSIISNYENILQMIAYWLSHAFSQLKLPVDHVIGIPNGGTALAKQISSELGLDQELLLEKEQGEIRLAKPVPPGARILLVEDCLTMGTAFARAVQVILANQPKAEILPVVLAFLNRGGLKQIEVEALGSIRIIRLVDYFMQDWAPNNCPLCMLGSEPIKPKATSENWRRITSSQI